MVCNGLIPLSLLQRIQACRKIVAVDGGVNFCAQNGIQPSLIVGDFDSADPAALEALSAQAKVIRLPRDKDVTDLEAALQEFPDEEILLFGGLGGLKDHVLTHLFLLLRRVGSLFIIEEEELLFGINDSMGEVLLPSGYQYITLFPLNGIARNTHLQGTLHPLIDTSKLFLLPLQEKASLEIGQGELVVALSKKQEKLFANLLHRTPPFDKRVLPSKKTFFPTKRGERVSLIPLYGSVEGIVTEGLKWEFGERVKRLDKNFVGISNVCIAEGFSIQIQEGELLILY